MNLRFPWKRFEILHALLKLLEDFPENTNVLSKLQHTIIRYIKRDERSLHRFNDERARLSADIRRIGNTKLESRRLKEEKKKIERHIEQVKTYMFLWRSFGDAIAYLYLDRSAIKTLYFEVESMSPHMSAGYMTGKVGHHQELRFLRSILKKGIPVLLCDATNVIRHGDVCTLNNSDPIVFEVKSSRSYSARVNRQKNALDRIHEFFATDQTQQLRTLGPMHRVEDVLNPVYHKKIFNEAVENALKYGPTVAVLEEGMTLLVASSTNEMDQLLQNMPLYDGDRLTICNWNYCIEQREWFPYRPFLLAFDETALLKEFIKGKVVIVVVVNVDTLARDAGSYGYDVSILNDRDCIFEIVKAGADPSLPETLRCRMSYFYFKRASYELVSCRWMIQNSFETSESAFDV